MLDIRKNELLVIGIAGTTKSVFADFTLTLANACFKENILYFSSNLSKDKIIERLTYIDKKSKHNNIKIFDKCKTIKDIEKFIIQYKPQFVFINRIDLFFDYKERKTWKKMKDLIKNYKMAIIVSYKLSKEEFVERTIINLKFNKKKKKYANQIWFLDMTSYTIGDLIIEKNGLNKLFEFYDVHSDIGGGKINIRISKKVHDDDDDDEDIYCDDEEDTQELKEDNDFATNYLMGKIFWGDR